MGNAKTLPSFRDVTTYLDTFTNYERVTDYQAGPAALGTERIEALLEHLGRPQAAAPALHVAGSKGKGSTCYLAARLLQAMHYRVGLYASPHVKHLRERIQIDGIPCSEGLLCECFAQVRAAVECMREHTTLKPPTYFEILTSLAFSAFARAGVDVAVVEVGLGGRLDATNVRDLPVQASGITPISRDHTKQLGEDLLDIAGEKAGILRPGTPLILGPQETRVAAFLRQRAVEIGSPLHTVGHDLTAQEREAPPKDAPEAPQRLDLETWRARHHDIPLPLLGAHQQKNAAMALGLVESFLEQRQAGPADAASLRRAWRDASLPGRIEVVARSPWVVLDGAHNPASAWALADTLVERFAASERVLVFAAARDKETETMLRILAPLARSLVLTTISSPRCFDPDAAARFVRSLYDIELSVEPDPCAAMEAARALAGPGGLVCATGSLYLVGALRPLFGGTEQGVPRAAE